MTKTNQETRKKRSTVELEISPSNSKKIVEFALDIAQEYDYFETVRQSQGCLVDSYIIYNVDDHIKIGRYKPRKYIILRENYLNEWSSDIVITLTDDENILHEMEEIFDNEEKNEEDYLVC